MHVHYMFSRLLAAYLRQEKSGPYAAYHIKRELSIYLLGAGIFKTIQQRIVPVSRYS